MKTINTQGIAYLERLEGTPKWYWGTNYIHGDLYEAEELFNDHHPIKSNTLLFISYPEGEVIEPIKPQDGCYFGRPIYCDGHIIILLVDFNHQLIRIEQYDECTSAISTNVSVPLSEVKDCYNLLLHTYPLMLTRQGNENLFEIIYPDKIQFPIGDNESFTFRKGDKLYFSAWYEDDEYREEVIIRDIHTGAVIDSTPGSITVMPDGQEWLLH